MKKYIEKNVLGTYIKVFKMYDFNYLCLEYQAYPDSPLLEFKVHTPKSYYAKRICLTLSFLRKSLAITWWKYRPFVCNNPHLPEQLFN